MGSRAKSMFFVIRIFFLIICFFAGPTWILAQGVSSKKLYRVFIRSQDEAAALFSVTSDVHSTKYGEYVDVWCSEDEAQLLHSRGLAIQEKTWPNMMPEAVLAEFHDYREMEAFLKKRAEKFPDICRLESIGKSIQNRNIWALKISDNPWSDEDEPCLLIEGCIHGNEYHALEVCLFFIDYLLNNYGFDQEVTHWIEEREIWVVPLVNPDGRELRQRYNANGVDLNRNFGYWWSYSAARYGPHPFSEPETRTIRDLAYRLRPYSSLAFHTAGRKILYPWAYTSEVFPPDIRLFKQTAQEIADSINRIDPTIQYQAIRSGTWYWHGGEHNDWMYSQNGMISFTIELMTSQSAPPSPEENLSVLPALRVLLRLPEKRGVTGRVFDALSGNPLPAVVSILELFDAKQLKTRCADSTYGRFIRLLPEGFYNLSFYYPGYRMKNIPILATQDSMLNLEITIDPAADLVIDQLQILDDVGTFSTGTGNGCLNPGETAQLTISLENLGPEAAESVVGKIQCADSSSIIQWTGNDSLYWEVVPGFSRARSENVIHIFVQESARPGKKVPFFLQLSDRNGNTWTRELILSIQGFFDDMESEGMGQWRHGPLPGAINRHDDWQYGSPQGKNNDPMQAYSGKNVWGTDLGGKGWNGAYQNQVHSFLETPPIDCSGWSRVYLEFYRWLNVLDGDTAYIQVNGHTVWHNAGEAILDHNWKRICLEISHVAANSDSIIVRFGLRTDVAKGTGGWNIDNVLVADSPSIASFVDNRRELLPKTSALAVFPNPSSGPVTIQFWLDQTQDVSFQVLNLLGQVVYQKRIGKKFPGERSHFWGGEGFEGNPLPSGVYFLRICANRHPILIQKILIVH